MHRIIKLRQKEWMKDYIQLNNYLKAKTKNDFETNFF